MSVNKTLVGLVSGSLLILGAVQTAKAEQSTLDLRGAYVGLHLGPMWGGADYSEPNWPIYDRDADMDGFSGGFLAGYNFQTRDLVYGIEVDLSFTDFSASADKSAPYNNYSAFDLNLNGHARARLGVMADKTLFYVAGGLAMANLKVDDVDPGWGDDKSTHLGWTLGAGVERIINDRLSVRLEYLYDDYGNEEYRLRGDDFYDSEVELSAHTMRAAISYRF